MNHEAVEVYKSKKAKIQAHLATINKHIKANINTPMHEINWAHVGTIGYIEDQLSQLCDMLEGTGEYAE